MKENRIAVNSEALEVIKKNINCEYITEHECLIKHKNLVRKTLYPYIEIGKKWGVSEEDLLQEGYVGLLLAFRKFDDKRGIKFSTLAVPYIKGTVQRYFRDKTRVIRLPRRVVDLAFVINKKENRDLTVNELSKKLNIGEKEIVQLQQGLKPVLSLNKTIVDIEGNGITFEDILFKEQDFTSIEVAEFVKTLSVKEQTVIKMLLEDKVQRQIGEELNVTQANVSKLITRIGLKYKKYKQKENSIFLN